jgi:hypothetical protein
MPFRFWDSSKRVSHETAGSRTTVDVPNRRRLEDLGQLVDPLAGGMLA